MERSGRCRLKSHSDASLSSHEKQDSVDESTRSCLARTVRQNNPAWRRLAHCGAATLIAAAAAGCSLSFPIAGFKTERTPTGSIDHTSAFLSPALDHEDLRRAEAALAVALDPQGNGGKVAWQNPQTGAKGSFAAAAPPFTDHDQICRAFAAEVAPETGSEHRMTGSACREDNGSWRLRDDRAASQT